MRRNGPQSEPTHISIGAPAEPLRHPFEPRSSFERPGCAAMPLLKPESLPIPPEEVTELRARLLTPLSHDVIARDDQRYLFVRAQGDVPHPVHDLEAAFEALPA